MSKFLKLALAGAFALVAVPAFAQGDAANGEKVFRKCGACHAVGEGAKHKVGPQLNDLFGRTAGTAEDYKYSKAMIEAGENGLVWQDDTLHDFLADPRSVVKGSKMAFAGLKKQEELDDVVAYLKTFSPGAEDSAAAQPEAEAAASETAATEAPADASATQAPAEGDGTDQASAPEAGGDDYAASHTREGGVYGLGREATPEEVAAWDIDVRPDGAGLPEGSGTVADGDMIFQEQCASCHGVFGEGAGRWPVLAGGFGTLTEERPEKTVGSYWPFLSTVFDYVRRAMPFGNAHSLSDDEVYALTAYILYLNDIVTEEDFELSKDNFTEIEMPNEGDFIEDTRYEEPHYAEKSEPCMENCKDGPVEVSMRARILDVTPGNADDQEDAGAGSVD